MINLNNYKSGHYEKGVAYRYFVPTRVNENWVWESPELNLLLEKAALRLGELNSFARLVPSVDRFIQLHVTKEAVDSSRIEGTQTNMEEAVLPDEEIQPERRNDWQEVQNYTRALNQAVSDLKTLPLSSRLLRKTHAVLLSGVRGEHKLPGEYRTSQNWIGGASLADASFIPPHHQYIGDLMGDLENFLHNTDIQVPALIKAAIAHYQFETIHPFLDGNGRIGRLLITLFLIDQQLLDQPLLYLSTYFEKNKNLYYDNLTRVRTHHAMEHWIKYFLVGIIQSSTVAVRQLQAMLKLKEDMEQELHDKFGRRATSGRRLMQHLFPHPVVSVDTVSVVCDLSYKSANDLVSAFQKSGYLVEVTGQSRNRLFSFQPYLSLFAIDQFKEVGDE